MLVISSRIRNVLYGVAGLAILLILFIAFHLGGISWEFSQLVGAMVGGVIALYAARLPIRDEEEVEPWLGREKIAWTLIGCGLIMWGLGESVWRYYILTNQSPFPSYADIGYSSLPPLVFIGLLLQPSSGIGRSRFLTLLDSLIAMSSLLVIGWFLLLGSLALASNENVLAKFLGLYYPTSDIALLSSVVLLLLRGQGSLYQTTARRISFLVFGIGLCFFAASDFVFNVQQNANAYVEGTFIDLGWPLGILIIGLAAYLRRMLPLTSSDMLMQRLQKRADRVSFGPAQYITYLLLAVVFIILLVNAFSTNKTQIAIRPVLLVGTVFVVALVVARQVFTILENERLSRRQADALERLERANTQIEEQATAMSNHNAELEIGVQHLKDVQARLANGNLRARASLTSGELLPLAVSLNLMAERLSRVEQVDAYARGLRQALHELSMAIEQFKRGKPFIVPPLCKNFPEIMRLLVSLEIRESVDSLRSPQSPKSPTTPYPSRPLNGPGNGFGAGTTPQRPDPMIQRTPRLS